MLKAMIKKDWALFRHSFRLDRRFVFVFLLELAIIGILLGGYYLLTLKLYYLAPQAGSVMDSLSVESTYSSPLALTLVKDNLMYVYHRIIAYTIIFGLVALVAWFAGRMLIYNVVSRTRPSLRLLWRFALLAAAASIVFTIVFFFLEYLLGMVMVNSGRSFAGQGVIVFFTMLFVLVLFYLMIAFLTPLARTSDMRSSIKGVWSALKKIHLAIIPIVLQLLVFVIINIMMFALLLLPRMFAMVLTGILVLAFFVWIRLYDTAVLDSVLSAGHGPKHRAVSHGHLQKKKTVINKKKK